MLGWAWSKSDACTTTQSALMPSEQPVTFPAMSFTTITVTGTPIVTPGSGAVADTRR